MDKPPPYNPSHTPTPTNQAYPDPPPQYQQPQQQQYQQQQYQQQPRQPQPPYSQPQPPYTQPPPRAPPQQHTTVVYHQQPPPVVQTSGSGFGGMLSSMASGASKFAGSVYTSVQREVDLHSTSANLLKFRGGNVVQLISSSNGCALRLSTNGRLDSLGALTDPATHFECINHGNNIISLRSMINPACYVAIQKGQLFCSGTFDYNSKFRLHETLNGYITLESVASQGNYIAVQSDGQIIPPSLSRNNRSAEFSVNLIRSVYPAQTVVVPPPGAPHTTTYVTTTTYPRK